MKTVYGAVITCLTSLPVPVCRQTTSPQTHTLTLPHAHTHTAWYVWNKSSSIMKPLAQAWPVLALSAMAVTIFCQHWLRLLLSWLHAIEFHAQPLPPLLLNKEPNSAPKQIKWVYGGVRMWHAGRFVPPTSSALQLWQDVFGRWNVGEGGYERRGWVSRTGSLVRFKKLPGHLVRVGTSQGRPPLRVHEPACPGDIQLCGKLKKKNSHLKEKTSVGFSATLPVFQHWALEL